MKEKSIDSKRAGPVLALAHLDMNATVAVLFLQTFRHIVSEDLYKKSTIKITDQAQRRRGCLGDRKEEGAFTGTFL